MDICSHPQAVRRIVLDIAAAALVLDIAAAAALVLDIAAAAALVLDIAAAAALVLDIAAASISFSPGYLLPASS